MVLQNILVFVVVAMAAIYIVLALGRSFRRISSDEDECPDGGCGGCDGCDSCGKSPNDPNSLD